MEKELKIIKFESGEISFDVRIDYEVKDVWLSQKDMSILYGKKTDTIGYNIKRIFRQLPRIPRMLRHIFR